MQWFIVSPEINKAILVYSNKVTLLGCCQLCESANFSLSPKISAIDGVQMSNICDLKFSNLKSGHPTVLAVYDVVSHFLPANEQPTWMLVTMDIPQHKLSTFLEGCHASGIWWGFLRALLKAGTKQSQLKQTGFPKGSQRCPSQKKIGWCKRNRVNKH